MSDRVKIMAVVALVTALLPAVGFATVETVLEVAQPIKMQEGGVCVAKVTYLKYLGTFPFGYLVYYTCKESCVMTEHHGCVNWNAANLLGLKAGCHPAHFDADTLFGDTLKVYLDLSGVDFEKKTEGFTADAVVRATVQCVLINALASREAYHRVLRGAVKAKHIQLEVRGCEKYASLGGVWDCDKDLANLPRKARFF